MLPQLKQLHHHQTTTHPMVGVVMVAKVADMAEVAEAEEMAEADAVVNSEYSDDPNSVSARDDETGRKM